MICLSEEQKELLRKPLGKKINLSKASNPLVAVGDYVSFHLIREGIKPHLAVVDFKNERKPIDESWKLVLLSSYKRRIHINNPRGCISDEALRLSKAVWHHLPLLVIVEGEEDLVGLPLLSELKEGYSLVYGMRGVGAILTQNRERAKELLELFHKPIKRP